jgi:GNAT superfamily N-acetyltransferase
MVRIRKVKDWTDVEYLHSICRPVQGQPDYKNTDWWVGYDQGQPVCYAGLEHQDSWALFSSAGVIPEYRGQGLQKRLIKARLKWLRVEGCKYAYTYTLPYNAASLNSLLRCGFKIYESKTDFAGPDYVYLRYIL